MRLTLFLVSLIFSIIFSTPSFAITLHEDTLIDCTDLSHTTSLAVAQVTWKLLNCNTLEISYYDQDGHRYQREVFPIQDSWPEAHERVPHARAETWIWNPSPSAHEKAQAWIWNPPRTQLLNHINVHDTDAQQKLRITNIYSLSGNSVLKHQHREEISLDALENWEMRSESSTKTYRRF